MGMNSFPAQIEASSLNANPHPGNAVKVDQSKSSGKMKTTSLWIRVRDYVCKFFRYLSSLINPFSAYREEITTLRNNRDSLWKNLSGEKERSKRATGEAAIWKKLALEQDKKISEQDKKISEQDKKISELQKLLLPFLREEVSVLREEVSVLREEAF